MLLELTGKGTISKCTFNDDGTVTLDLEFREVVSRGGVGQTILSERQVLCTNHQAEQLFKFKNEDMTGWFIDVSANAETVGNDLDDVYRANSIHIIGNRDSANNFGSSKAKLKGTGEIKRIIAVEEQVAKILVVNTEMYGDKEVKGMRWVTVLDKAAKWYLSNSESLIGSWLQFVADGETKRDNDAYDNEEEMVLNFYVAKRHSVVWNNNLSVREQG